MYANIFYTTGENETQTHVVSLVGTCLSPTGPMASRGCNWTEVLRSASIACLDKIPWLYQSQRDNADRQRDLIYFSRVGRKQLLGYFSIACSLQKLICMILNFSFALKKTCNDPPLMVSECISL